MGTYLGSVIGSGSSRGHLLCSFHKIFELFLVVYMIVTLLIYHWVTEKSFHHADIPLISVMLTVNHRSAVIRLR